MLRGDITPRASGPGVHAMLGLSQDIYKPGSLKKHVNYCKEYRDWTAERWKRPIFSDECSISTAQRGTKCVTRMTGKQHHKHCIAYSHWSGRSSFMIWGAIAYN